MSPNNEFSREDIIQLIQSPLFQALMDKLSLGIGLLDNSGTYLFVNEAYARHHGGTGKESYVAKHVTELFLTGNTGTMKVIRSGKPVVGPCRSFDGTKGMCSRIPIIGKNRKVVGVLTETLATNISRENLSELINTLRELAEEAEYYKHKAHSATGALYTFDAILSRSDSMKQLKKIGKKYAATEHPILIFGESGTGKELLAQAVHMASQRSERPFVTVNCAALPPSLIESELFGYVAGTFTGARSSGMKGKFESAHRGTIFLDEIGELPLDIQSKLLRVLESGEIQKIGQNIPVYSDFRLIAATNRNLPEMIRQGTFREDLYHRISALELRLPPLRQRVEDIPLLVRILMEEILGQQQAKNIELSQNCLSVLMSAPWHGNIRELKNVLTAALCTLDDNEKILKPIHLSPRFLMSIEKEGKASKSKKGKTTLSQVSSLAERETIINALKNSGGNRSRAALALGISRSCLYKKLREYKINIR